jgi:tricorn protease
MPRPTPGRVFAPAMPWIHHAPRSARFAALLMVVLSVPASAVWAAPGYLRTPALHGDRLVFNAEGDLWTARADGSGVRRLTTHPGDEVLPRISPDGKWIAFAGDYDGNRDLFVIPADGGEPKRLTWHPGADEPVGWTPDGSRILFRSRRDSPEPPPGIYAVPREGGEPERLPIGGALDFSVDPQSGRYAFTRNRGGGTWKRYRGGSAEDIWVGDPGKGDFARVTTFDGTDTEPMWHGGRIYFLCDQGGAMNIWSMNPDGTGRTQLTRFDTWDARQASLDPTSGCIAFTLAADIHIYDPASNTERLVAIDLPSERTLTRIRYPDAEQYLRGFALAPEGDRVAVEARGEIFSLPAKEGVTLPLSFGSGAREDRVAYDPKGERVAYITDASGDEAMVTADAWGRGQVKQLVAPGVSGHAFPPTWSPDGTWIAWGDQTNTLWIVKAAGGDPLKVDRAEQWEINEYTWSPDGRWLAYTKADKLGRGAIYVYDTKEAKIHRVTDWTTENRTPAWDPDGRYLYFISDRVIQPLLGDMGDFEQIQVSPARPCLLLLRPDVKNPFAATAGAPPGPDDKKDGKDGKGKKTGKSAQSDAKKDEKGDADKKEAKDEKPEPVEINFDGIESRVVEVPVEPGRYFGLAATSGKLFYLSFEQEPLFQGDSDGAENPGHTLVAFDLEEKEAKPFLEGVVGFDLQPKADKIAVRKAGHGGLFVFDAGSPPGDNQDKKKVSTADIVIELDPREEWRQAYFQAWRRLRDHYWDADMHGVDWKGVRDQYAVLLPRLGTRDDLRDLIAEMIGELSTSHTYVWGGDRGVEVTHVATGLLGAQVKREADAFRVERIYRGAPADRVRSPLDEPGSMVKEGEYILALNNRAFAQDLPFEAAFAGLAGKEILLTVNAKPSLEGSRTVVATAMKGNEESDLRYADWVRHNREYVAEKTGGKIGYVHLPDMGGRGLKEFDTWFYPQLDKEGMVVDARFNGGGFVSQLIVERLMRHVISFDRARGGGISTYPQKVLNGPFVVLTNEYAGSDGDIFPKAIQRSGLAPVIGKRSWGGVIGIRGAWELADGGGVTSPEFAYWWPKEGWAVEGHGVDPDIEVDNLPQELGRGVDAQLDRGIQEVLRLRQEKPPVVPNFGPVPDHSRKAFQKEK